MAAGRSGLPWAVPWAIAAVGGAEAFRAWLVRSEVAAAGAIAPALLLAVFQARSIHREAMGALSVLQQAAEADRAGHVLVREIGSFLRKARKHPDLQFTWPTL